MRPNLKAIGPFHGDILDNTQFIQSIISLNLQTFLIGKMQKTNKTETSADICKGLLGIHGVKPTNDLCKFLWRLFRLRLLLV